MHIQQTSLSAVFLLPPCFCGGFFVITKGVNMQKVSYMGNGETTEFTFNFPYFENTDVVVTKNGTTATGYNIVGNSAGLDADIPYNGGTVVFETAPTALDSITIARQLPLERQYDYQPLVKIDPTTLNQDMNYLMEVLKDLQDELDGLRAQYADIADKDSTEVLLAKMQEIHNEIVAVSAQITALGDVSQIRSNISTLDNRTTGILDYVVASQIPTSENNYTWYRKYKSGWIEQGGRNDGMSTVATITMPNAMADITYGVLITRLYPTTADDPVAISHQVRNLTTTTFQVRQTFAASGVGHGSSYAYNWVIYGVCA